MTGKKTFDRVWFVALRHGRHNDLKGQKALHSSYIPLRRQRAAFLLSDSACFCHLLSDQDGKPNVDHDPKPRRKMVEASFQRMARSPIAQVLHKFSQAPGTPINSKPSHSHELSATNHKVIYIKTNNVTHSERMTSHHYHKFTVIEKASNWQIFLHAYDEMVSERTGGQIVLQIFTDASPSVATKSILAHLRTSPMTFFTYLPGTIMPKARPKVNR